MTCRSNCGGGQRCLPSVGHGRPSIRHAAVWAVVLGVHLAVLLRLLEQPMRHATPEPHGPALLWLDLAQVPTPSLRARAHAPAPAARLPAAPAGAVAGAAAASDSATRPSIDWDRSGREAARETLPALPDCRPRPSRRCCRRAAPGRRDRFAGTRRSRAPDSAGDCRTYGSARAACWASASSPARSARPRPMRTSSMGGATRTGRTARCRTTRAAMRTNRPPGRGSAAAAGRGGAPAAPDRRRACASRAAAPGCAPRARGRCARWRGSHPSARC